ncbi:MAG: two-component system alkaline phosphatase synthesis response regulator PhoP [Rhodothermales bacterium]|jgi:two-component system alkaline phosphatase synthesis response regulator PhoP
MTPSILLVEDDRDIAELIRINLSAEGFDVVHHANGRDALHAARTGVHELIVLDLMLPGLNGLEFCREFRQVNRFTPIIMLTAKSDELDRVLGLEMGADDYLTKPFSVRELVARIKAIRRRMETNLAVGLANSESDLSVFGPLEIRFIKRLVTLNGENVDLTAKEFDLLALFARNPGRAYTRRALLDSVWDYQFDGYDHTVNSHINRLRGKIEDDPRAPVFIKTVWGVGYRFAEAEEFGP